MNSIGNDSNNNSKSFNLIKKKWSTIQAACLIVITDDNADDHDHFSYLLKFLSRKLIDCGNIFLRQTFFITKSDYSDLLNQFNYLLSKYEQQNFIFLSSTDEKLDVHLRQLIIDSRLDETNVLRIPYLLNEHPSDHDTTSLSIYDSHVILLTKKSIHENVAIFFKHLAYARLQDTKYFFNFNSNLGCMNKFLDGLFKIALHLDTEISHRLVKPNEYGCYCSISCPNATGERETELIVNKIFTNYANENYLIEVTLSNSFNKKLNEFLDVEHTKNGFLLTLIDNYINADYYLYEFEKCFKYLLDIDQLNQLNHKSVIRKDLVYLLGKVNLNQFKRKLRETLQLIETSLIRYGQDRSCISFNGGKDCCVVLFLYFAVATRLAVKLPINVLYIKIKNQFKEMDHFIDNVINKFYRKKLNFITFEDTSKSLKDCLKDLKLSHPGINTIYMGTRRSDGSYFKHMPALAPTDGDWPSYMRVNPILDWHFSEIWFFIRLIQLPYCSLYDKGYTSIDNALNTIPNAALAQTVSNKLNGTNETVYLPAYLLEEQDLERNSRKKS